LGIVQQMFPNGSVINEASYNPSRDFRLFVVPPIQCDWLRANVMADFAECREAPAQFEPTPVPTSAP
jgi:hypothetical protein